MADAASPSAPCPNCEVLPGHLTGPGILYLWCPLGHSRKKLAERAGEGGFAIENRPDLGAIAVTLGDGVPEAFAEWMRPVFSQMELGETKALFLPPETAPGAAHIGQVKSLGEWLAAARSGWLLDLLHEERVETHYQPIVEAADPRRIYAYEALLRGRQRDGGFIGGGPIFGLASEADLLFQVDLAARRSAVRNFQPAGLGPDRRVFINFTPTSIYDPAYCLRTTFQAVHEAGIRPEQVVFEVVESEEVNDLDTLVRTLEQYREAGFGVALDDLGSGFASLNLLHTLKPDFVKLDMGLIQGVDGDTHKAAIAGKLLEAADSMGSRTVAEGVERMEELHWLRDNGADLLQGFLFAYPAAQPPQEGPSLL
jgi:EAL domain-containing protein (putative c-di-GMP-specific phosphodiesterase class I)